MPPAISNAPAKALDSAVTDIRMDEDGRREYMGLNELIRENRRLGERRRCVSVIRNSRNRIDIRLLAEIMKLQPRSIQDIAAAIEAHPDWDDEQVAESIDFG